MAAAVPLAARFALPNGVVVGLGQPWVLAALPVAAVVLWALVFRRAGGTASARSRRRFLAARLVLAGLLVVAAAGPFTVVTMETPGEPSVSLLVDRSDSTTVSPAVAEELAALTPPFVTATLVTMPDTPAAAVTLVRRTRSGGPSRRSASP